MSGGPGSPIGAPLQAVGKGIKMANDATQRQRQDQVAQMASQRILLQPQDAVGRKLYKEAMALRTANPGIIGAPGGSSFMYTPPAQTQLQIPEIANPQGLQRVFRERFGGGAALPVPVQYTVPGAPSAVRQAPISPLDPNSVLASMRRDSMAGTRTPAQLRLAELLGK